jgi:hypothetical protein
LAVVRLLGGVFKTKRSGVMTIQAFLTALRNLLWGKPAEQPDDQLRVLATATADHRMLTMEPSERSTSMNRVDERIESDDTAGPAAHGAPSSV